jgi:hypothetical protein
LNLVWWILKIFWVLTQILAFHDKSDEKTCSMDTYNKYLVLLNINQLILFKKIYFLTLVFSKNVNIISSENHQFTEQKLFCYRANTNLLPSENNFLWNKNPFFIEHLIRTQKIIPNIQSFSSKSWPLFSEQSSSILGKMWKPEYRFLDIRSFIWSFWMHESINEPFLFFLFVQPETRLVGLPRMVFKCVFVMNF